MEHVIGTFTLPLGSVFTGQPEVIASTVLTATAASVRFSFSPIYRLILLTGFDTYNAYGYETIRLNNDSGANYCTTTIKADGGSVAAPQTANDTSFSATGTSIFANTGGMNPVVIVSKPSANAKAMITYQSALQQSGGAGDIKSLTSTGLWSNTADLLYSIDIVAASYNLSSPVMSIGSSFTLWGYRL